MSDLSGFVRICKELSRHKDIVQGGGGNVSVKKNGVMQIKASGYSFSDVDERKGYASVRCDGITDFFNSTRSQPGDLSLEGQYDEALSRSKVDAQSPRPSLETGMHVFLGKFVAHTHPVMVNAFNCIRDGEKALREITPMPEDTLFLDYCSPGYNLGASVMQGIAKHHAEHGHAPAIIFLKNHGLVVSADDPDDAVARTRAIEEKAEQLLMDSLGRDFFGFPELKFSCSAGSCSGRNAVFSRFIENLDENQGLLDRFLLPDDVVYFSGNVSSCGRADGISLSAKEDAVIYPWDEAKSKKVDEVLAARLYLLLLTQMLGKPEYLSTGAVRYIQSMNSEKYRQNLKQ